MPGLQLPDGTAATTDVDKTETFKCFFPSQNVQSAIPDPGPSPSIPQVTPKSKLLEIHAHISEVVLSKLDVKKAAGDDGVPTLTRLLRFLSREIALCIHHLFELSLKIGELPCD